MDLDVPDAAAAIVTDSLSQMAEFGQKFILNGTRHEGSVAPLRDFLNGAKRPAGMIASYPLGVSGSDVVVADDLISRHQS